MFAPRSGATLDTFIDNKNLLNTREAVTSRFRVMSDRERARQLVADITNEHGFVSEGSWERLGQLDPELRRKFEVAMLRKDEMIGSSVIT